MFSSYADDAPTSAPPPEPPVEDTPEGDLTPDPDALRRWVFPMCAAMARYHRFEAKGLEHIPEKGPALLVLGHGLATYDFFLIAYEIFRKRNRLLRALAHRLWFKIPVLKAFAGTTGMTNAAPGKAGELLREGHIVAVAPGGVREMVRSYRERFQVRWEGRRGFARLALETGSPVVLGTCPGADLIYTVYPSRVTDWVYNQFKLPMPILRGFGLTVAPRPVKLTYHLSEPIQPPAIAGEEPTDAEVEAFYMTLHRAMRDLINAAVEEENLEAYRI